MTVDFTVVSLGFELLVVPIFFTDDDDNDIGFLLDCLKVDDDIVLLKLLTPVYNLDYSAFMATVDLLIYLLTILSSDLGLLGVDFLPVDFVDDICGKFITYFFINDSYARF